MPRTQTCCINWAHPKEAADLVPLFRDLFRHEHPDTSVPNRAATLAHIDVLLSPETPHRLAIAWAEDGIAIGLAAVALFTSISDPHPTFRRQAELKELFVLRDFRHRGVGSRLMAWIEKDAIAKGAHRMDWHVKQDNHRGIAFYQRLGGSVVGNRASMRKALSRPDTSST